MNRKIKTLFIFICMTFLLSVFSGCSRTSDNKSGQIKTGIIGALAEEVTLSYIVTTNHDYMHKLLSIGLVPGTKLKLHQKFPTYIVKVNETQIALDGEVANLIYVRK